MEENKKEILGQFIQKSVKEAGLESPSPDFSRKVLSRLEGQRSLPTTFEPLISVRTWVLLSAIFIGIGLMAFLGLADLSENWMERVGLNTLLDTEFLDAGISLNLHLSNIVVYAVVGLGLFASFQIAFLKSRWDKRYLLDS